MVWYDICLHCRATAADMTAERSAWRGLWYDITGIKRRRDDSSERAHPDVSMDECQSEPIHSCSNILNSNLNSSYQGQMNSTKSEVLVQVLGKKYLLESDLKHTHAAP